MTVELETVDEGTGPRSNLTYRIVRESVSGQHFRLSCNGDETLAFLSDADGEPTDWQEVAGRMHGGQSIDEVQAELAQRLTDGSSARDENIDAMGGPMGAFATYVADIANELRTP